MAKAYLVLREKKTDEHGNLRELVIWKVRPSRQTPDGVRYRLALVRPGQKEPTVLYDNHHPKGHHRHIEGIEKQYVFVNLERLVADFQADIERVMGTNE
ncbi:MAG TPA: DUF6516 family protein [Candidatus Binataceae bacterium]|nr:DUF6516 family protein [Candidatus Binataceae bacterium]